MIKYNKVYRGVFGNIEVDTSNASLGVGITIDIYDTTSGEAVSPTEIINLDLAGTPCEIETVDNDEDKFGAVIRSKRATINIFSSDSIGIETFVDGGDTRYVGHIYSDTEDLLTGPVSISDVEEDFLPDPNIIGLIMSDGLGLLADEELRDENGDLIRGMNDIWTYIRACLLLTGQSLEALVIYNIREKTAPTINDADNADGHFFKHESLDFRTNEGANAGTAIKAADVIRNYLFGCFITQFNGKWLIVNIDELQGDSDVYVYSVDVDGVFTKVGLVDYSKSVGDGLRLSWMNADCIVSTERPLKKYNLKRIYEYFKEIPCNIDFERGTGSDPTGAADETIDYTPECWEFLREGTANVDLDTVPFAGSTGVLRKRFVYNYETERYLVTAQAGGFRHYFKSEAIRMDQFSKITIGIQYKFNNDISAATINVMHIRLIGDDGNIYDWERTIADANSWNQKVATDPVFDDTIQEDIAGTIDMRDWHSLQVTSPPVPVSGALYIRLLNDLASPVIRYFSALKVTVDPLINGTYAKFTGENDTVEQAGDNKGLREDELKIGSGPGVNVKGALQKRGTDIEIFSETVSFGTSHQFELTGDHRAALRSYIGQIIVISGSSLNDQETTLVSLNYSIIGNTTQVFIAGTTVLETSVAIVIKVAVYMLATLFYNAAVLPDGPTLDSQSKPFGEMVSFNVWNQYNRVMRKFDGTIDGLDTDSIMPGFIHKYTMADGNPNTGTRIFMLLHYRQNLHLCEWDGFFHEIHDPAQGKQYTGHSFKYLTE